MTTTAPSDAPGTADARRSTFFYENVVFKVENVLFQVHRYKLEAVSPIFADMFSIPPPTGSGQVTEGRSEANPIVLEGYKSVDFERLLTLLYPKDDGLPGDPAPLSTRDEWISVLKLANAWQMEKVRKMAIARISSDNLSPTEKILLGREHRVADWVLQGIEKIVTSTDLSEFTLEGLADVVGWETAARVLWIKHTCLGTPVVSPKKVQIDYRHLVCAKDTCSSPIRGERCTQGHIVERWAGGKGQWSVISFDMANVRTNEGRVNISAQPSTAHPAAIAKVFQSELQSLGWHSGHPMLPSLETVPSEISNTSSDDDQGFGLFD